MVRSASTKWLFCLMVVFRWQKTYLLRTYSAAFLVLKGMNWMPFESFHHIHNGFRVCFFLFASECASIEFNRFTSACCPCSSGTLVLCALPLSWNVTSAQIFDPRCVCGWAIFGTVRIFVPVMLNQQADQNHAPEICLCDQWHYANRPIFSIP